MINFEQGDIVLLPFPFSDQSSSKIRPAIIAHPKYPSDDLVVVGITSVGDSLRPGEFLIRGWKKAGLLHPSYAKRTIATISFNLVRRRLGTIDRDDLLNLTQRFDSGLGSLNSGAGFFDEFYRAASQSPRREIMEA